MATGNTPKEQSNTTKTTFREVLMIIKRIAGFGYPAVLDILFIRPFYWLPIWKHMLVLWQEEYC
jgi:hypothetical protein